MIAVGYRGVGDSTGTFAIDRGHGRGHRGVIRALGYDRVDLFGLSMGGMVAQAIAEQAPELIDRLILAGSGPAGGPGLTDMTGIIVTTVLRAVFTFNDPKALLFFTRTPAGKRPRASISRGWRSALPDATSRSPRRCIGRSWPRCTGGVCSSPLIFPSVTGPVLIVHGDSDRMVPAANAAALARQLPTASVTIFPDSGHGVVFQNHRAFVDAARDFLRR